LVSGGGCNQAPRREKPRATATEGQNDEAAGKHRQHPRPSPTFFSKSPDQAGGRRGDQEVSRSSSQGKRPHDRPPWRFSGPTRSLVRLRGRGSEKNTPPAPMTAARMRVAKQQAGGTTVDPHRAPDGWPEGREQKTRQPIHQPQPLAFPKQGRRRLRDTGFARIAKKRWKAKTEERKRKKTGQPFADSESFLQILGDMGGTPVFRRRRTGRQGWPRRSPAANALVEGGGQALIMRFARPSCRHQRGLRSCRDASAEFLAIAVEMPSGPGSRSKGVRKTRRRRPPVGTPSDGDLGRDRDGFSMKGDAGGTPSGDLRLARASHGDGRNRVRRRGGALAAGAAAKPNGWES